MATTSRCDATRPQVQDCDYTQAYQQYIYTIKSVDVAKGPSAVGRGPAWGIPNERR